MHIYSSLHKQCRKLFVVLSLFLYLLDILNFLEFSFLQIRKQISDFAILTEKRSKHLTWYQKSDDSQKKSDQLATLIYCQLQDYYSNNRGCCFRLSARER